MLHAFCMHRDLQPDHCAHEHYNHLPAAIAAPRAWEYKDLDGKTHGPFSSEKMLQWVTKGFFQQDLQVSVQRDLSANTPRHGRQPCGESAQQIA